MQSEIANVHDFPDKNKIEVATYGNFSLIGMSKGSSTIEYFSEWQKHVDDVNPMIEKLKKY